MPHLPLAHCAIENNAQQKSLPKRPCLPAWVYTDPDVESEEDEVLDPLLLLGGFPKQDVHSM